MSHFKIKVILIPALFGGLNGKLYENMRIGIRWQKYRSEMLNSRYDISLTNIQFNAVENVWEMYCHSIRELPAEWMIEGELIELIETYNIVAIGKIEGKSNSETLTAM